MEKIDTFEEFLKKKKLEEKSKKIDWNERRVTWLNSVDQLYLKIRTWLDPFMEQSLLDIKEKNVEINEEYIGLYTIRRLDIYLGNDLISLLPKGTLIIGSYGRVDMKGPKGEIMMVEQKWSEWKLAKRTPKFQTWDLTAESFKEAFQEVINGR